MNLKTRMQSCPRGHLPNSWNLGSSASHALSLLCHAAPQRDSSCVANTSMRNRGDCGNWRIRSDSRTEGESEFQKGNQQGEKKSKEIPLIFFWHTWIPIAFAVAITRVTLLRPGAARVVAQVGSMVVLVGGAVLGV